MGGTALGYRPALDGIRAVSITLVLAFHLGAPWMEGGYLGVSVFFTLSGFLITSLLLAERTGTGRIDVRSFYVRRLRRLLPASLLCISGIALLAAVGTIAARDDLRTGLLGAAFQVANWERLLGNQSYADLFAAPSPVDHFWSLAIEEQFYWVWPLAVAALTALAPRHVTRWLVGSFVVLGAGALVTARTLGGDAAYFASWARFAEILAGAALAALVAGRTISPRWGRVGAPALAAVLVLSVLTPAGRGWAYQGGLPLFAVLSALLILGAYAGGPVATLLAREPIPWIGRISYGLYLFHWPVFTVLGDAPVLEKLSMTLAISVASYYLIERPIRTGRWLVPRLVLQGGAIGFVAVVAGIAVLVPGARPRDERTSEPVVIAAGNALPMVAAAAVDPAPITTSSTLPRPTVVALFGDSVADWLLRDATPTFARSDITLVDAAVEGCDGAAVQPAGRGRGGQLLELPGDCRAWPESYPAVVENPSLPVDVAVLVLGYSPLVDRLVGGTWMSPCVDLRWYEADVASRVDYLREHVDEVVLALPSWSGRKASFLSTDDHLVRMGCIRDGLTAVAASTGAATVDLAELLCPAGPEGECSALRERDGAHVDAEDAPFVLDWLLQRL